MQLRQKGIEQIFAYDFRFICLFSAVKKPQPPMPPMPPMYAAPYHHHMKCDCPCHRHHGDFRPAKKHHPDRMHRPARPDMPVKKDR